MNLKTKLATGMSIFLMLSSSANAELIDYSSKKLTVINVAQSSPKINSNQANQNKAQAVSKPQASSTQSYAFPKAIQQGYWAMTTTMDGVASTVHFSDDSIDIHQFQCSPDGSFKKLKTYTYAMEPSAYGMGLKRQDGSHYSALKLMKFEPQKTLFMHQNFIANQELRRAMPNGVDLQYVYTPKLLPACPTHK